MQIIELHFTKIGSIILSTVLQQIKPLVWLICKCFRKNGYLLLMIWETYIVSVDM